MAQCQSINPVILIQVFPFIRRPASHCSFDPSGQMTPVLPELGQNNLRFNAQFSVKILPSF